MSAPELVLQYVQTLIWPLIAAWALFYFRKPLGRKIGDMTELKVGSASAKWRDKAAEVATRAEEAVDQQLEGVENASEAPTPEVEPQEASPTEGPAAEEGRLPSSPVHPPATAPDLTWSGGQMWVKVTASKLDIDREYDEARQVAAADPSGGILLAYERTVAVAERAARKYLPSLSGRTAERRLDVLVEAAAHGALPSEFIQVARDLRSLRNSAAHGAVRPTVDSALDFIAACERLASALELGRVLQTGTTDTRSRFRAE